MDPAAADGLNEFDRDMAAQGGLEDRLVGKAGAFAVQVAGPAGAVARGGAETFASAVADVHEVAVAFDAEVLPVGGEEPVHVAPSGLGDVLLEPVAVEAAAAARLHELQLRGGIQLGVDGREQIGEPVAGELILGLRPLQRFINRRHGGGGLSGLGAGAEDKRGARGAREGSGGADEFGAVHGISCLQR